MTELQPATKGRRDAVENRERILQAARELYAQVGVGVTLHDVVHQAGFGVGTAYRNFLNKEEVIDIVFGDKLLSLVGTGRRCLSDPDPWSGLTRFLEQSLQMQAADRGFSQVLNDPALGSERLDPARREIGELIVALVDRLNSDARLRPGIIGADVELLHGALAGLIDRARPASRTSYRKYLTIVLDGLSPTCGGAVPLIDLPVGPSPAAGP